MFDIKKAVKKEMYSVYRSRWIAYFNEWAVLDIHLEEDEDFLQFIASIKWSGRNVYKTVITIKKINKRVTHYCSCPAHNSNNWCKHVSALANDIECDLKISDDFTIYSKENNNEINTWFKNSKEIEKVKPQNKTDIFSRMFNYEFENDKKEKDLYKIKLKFFNYSSSSSDIEILLYKSKILKNWKHSSWKRIYKNDTDSLPNNLQKLWIFLEKKNTYNSRYEDDYWDENMTFLNWADFFSDALLELKIFDEKDKEIKISKNNYSLKFQTNPWKEWNVKIKIILDWWKIWNIELNWARLFWKEW